MKKLLPITNVHIASENGCGRVSLCCEYGDARYHVWALPNHLNNAEDDVLYKNPLVRIGQDGYFNTRRLDVKSSFGQKLLKAMVVKAAEDKLVEQFNEEKRKKEDADRQAFFAARILEWKRDAAQEMYAALKVIQLTPHIMRYLTEKDPKALLQVHQAIEKADGKKEK